MKRFIWLSLVAAGGIGIACSSDPATDVGSQNTDDAGKKDTTSGSDTSTTEDTGNSGNDTGTQKDTSSATDAPTDAPSDAGKAKACMDYCNCMDSVAPCDAVFNNKADCNTQCNAQTNWDLACRTTHCGLAKAAATKADRTTHCGHAEGMNLCVNK